MLADTYSAYIVRRWECEAGSQVYNITDETCFNEWEACVRFYNESIKLHPSSIIRVLFLHEFEMFSYNEGETVMDGGFHLPFDGEFLLV